MNSMKKLFVGAIKTMFADRALFRLAVTIIILTLLTGVTLAIRLNSTELQIATRYSAFGETQYYRNQWYYLLSFVIFIIMIAGTHVALMAKMQQRDMRNQAVLFGGLTIFILIIVSLIAHAVFSVAYLS